MKQESMVIVDKNDKIIGTETRVKCHESKGILHRAFMVLLFNKKNQLLITKRSKYKRLWPGFWSDSCCSHVYPKETYKKAAERRIKQELKIKCNLKQISKFRYNSKYKDIGSEHEICAVLIGKYDGKIKPIRREFAGWKFVDLDELKRDIKKNPKRYTPWFLTGFKKLKKRD